ncbi:MAG TPA: hypothetical protein VGL42_10210 [Opitutaceae bacterium]
MKLARTLAGVDKLVVERAYTPGADPGRKYYRENGAEMQTEDNLAAVYGKIDARTSLHGRIELETSVKVMTALFTDLNAAQAFSSADLMQNGNRAGQMQEELVAERFDAVRISFVVSADHPLVAPYLIATARYRNSSQ